MYSLFIKNNIFLFFNNFVHKMLVVVAAAVGYKEAVVVVDLCYNSRMDRAGYYCYS
jgi:hypothetical protein